MLCRDQFRVSNFKLFYPSGKDFAVSPWLPLPAVVGYRCLLALYCVSWIIYSIVSGNTWKWLIFLTNWTFSCVANYFMWSAVTSVIYWIHIRNRHVNNCYPDYEYLPEEEENPSSEQTSDSYYTAAMQSGSDPDKFLEQQSCDAPEDPKHVSPIERICDHDTSRQYSSHAYKCFHDFDYPQKWYHKVSWVFYIIAANNSVLVTVLYWTLLYSRGSHIGGIDISFHILNSVFMLIETFLSSIPVQLFHIVYAVLYGILYVLFSVLYWSFGGTNNNGHKFIYPVLDYGSKPYKAAVLIVLYGIVALPVAQLLIFGLFKLRCYLRTLHR